MTTTQHHLEHLTRAAMAYGAHVHQDLVREGRIIPNRPLGEQLGMAPTYFLDARTDLVEWANLPRTITGSPAAVTAALEALPDGTIIRPSEEATADRECAAFIATHGYNGRTWEGTGVTGTFATQYLAHNCTPITVIA